MYNLFLYNYYKNIIKFDLINKFEYRTEQKIPKLKKIVINCNLTPFKTKNYVKTLLTLKLLTEQKGLLNKTKKANIFLKIQKGQPNSCKIILKKTNMYKFLQKLLLEIFPQLNPIKIKKNAKLVSSFSFTLKPNQILFSEIKNNYSIIDTIANFNITIVTSCLSNNELIFLLKSFHFPITVIKN